MRGCRLKENKSYFGINHRRFLVIAKRMNCGRLSQKRGITIGCENGKAGCLQSRMFFQDISRTVRETFSFSDSSNQTFRKIVII